MECLSKLSTLNLGLETTQCCSLKINMIEYSVLIAVKSGDLLINSMVEVMLLCSTLMMGRTYRCSTAQGTMIISSSLMTHASW